MTIKRFDFDTRIHHGVIHNDTVYLTPRSDRIYRFDDKGLALK